MHDLTACFGAAVFVEQRSERRGARNRNDGLQVLAALGSSFPGGCALVGLAVNGHVAVAPVLGAEPFNSGVNALALAVSSIVKAPRALFSGEHGNLRQRVAVWNEIVVDEFTSACPDHVGGAGLTAG